MGIEFKTLEQFMPFWSQKILPAVYDDSLSYYQLLGRILQKYNELVEVVNKHSETLVDHDNRITANEKQIELNRQQIEALKTALAELEKEVERNTANIAALTERVNGHDQDIAKIQSWIESLANATAEISFMIDTSEQTISFKVAGETISYADALSTLIKKGQQTLDGNFATGQPVIVGLNSTATTGQLEGFGVGIEDSKLHYFTFKVDAGSTSTVGAISEWSETEILEISDIVQSEGTEAYKVMSQKVVTDYLKSKMAKDMGITGAEAGMYLNITSVDQDGRPLTYGFGTPGGGGSGVDIVQTTGQSTTSVMSQKAVTDALTNTTTTINNTINSLATATTPRVTVTYPTTTSGTNGKFVDSNGKTLTKAEVAALILADGKNLVFTAKPTGSSEFSRIMWAKSSAGDGIWDFEWWDYNGTTAKMGIDRFTFTTAGNFATSTRNGFTIPSGGSVNFTDFGDALFTDETGSTNVVIQFPYSGNKYTSTQGYLQLPFTASTTSEAYSKIKTLGGITLTLHPMTGASTSASSMVLRDLVFLPSYYNDGYDNYYSLSATLIVDWSDLGHKGLRGIKLESNRGYTDISNNRMFVNILTTNTID